MGPMFPPCHEELQLIVKMYRYVATSTGDPAFFHIAHCHEGANCLSVYGEINLISLGVCMYIVFTTSSLVETNLFQLQ